MENAVATHLCSSPNRHLRIDEIAMSHHRICRDVGTLVNRIDGLHLSVFLEEFHQKLPVLGIINGHKSLRFFTNQLQKPFVFSSSQHGHVIDFGAVEASVFVQQSIHNHLIACEDF